MNDSYTMIPVKSSTRDILKQKLKELTVKREGQRTTYNDLVLSLVENTPL